MAKRPADGNPGPETKDNKCAKWSFKPSLVDNVHHPGVSMIDPRLWEFNVLCFPTQEDLALRLVQAQPKRFKYWPSTWKKFADSGMDDITLGGFFPENAIKSSHVLFLADFFCNDAILSQLHAFITLCESFIRSLTIVLSYFPVATNERVMVEGQVATANTVSRMLSHLPMCGRPTRVMFYDLHTLQNRFYLHTGALSSLHSAIPLIQARMHQLEGEHKITAVAFPDEGAQKRFGMMFADLEEKQILCGKKRIGEKREVVIQDGHCVGDHVLIVDDLVRTGGTLAACAKVLLEHGARRVSAFVVHAAFPGDSFKKFCRGGEMAVFDRFYITSSNPTVARLIEKDADDVFEILDILPLLLQDI